MAHLGFRIVGMIMFGLVLGFTNMASMSAQAQTTGEKPGEERPNWFKFCGKEQQTNIQGCIILSELRTGTGQLVVSAAIREREGEERKTLIISVPAGMLLQPGIKVQIDKAKSTNGKYSICFANLCYAELLINNDYVTQMKRGGQLQISAINQQGKSVSFKLTLKGFTASYDGPALKQEEHEQAQKELQKELQDKAEQQRQKLIEAQKQQTSTEN